MILFEKKHLEVRQKYSAARRIFNSLPGVSSGDETLRLMFDAQAKLFFHKLDFLIFDKHSGSYELCFLLFKRDNILHAWHFSARMAHFPCMFLIDLILSTYLKDFFSVVSSLFFLLKRINENFAVRLG